MAKKVGSRKAGSGLSEGHARKDEASYKELFFALRDELDNLRAQYAAVLVKLDADAGVTDTDFASSLPLETATWEK